jgi:subtilisin family serine protease
LALNYAVTNGRDGKGCVVFFAAGNGNESVDNDGYASYDRVLAVAACNDRGRRSVYSDFGDAIFCAFPSNDREFAPEGRPAPLTPGIWTTDLMGRAGDSADNYTNSFGGTSSACPGAAGVAALVLSRNPSLHWREVKHVLRRCCDRIDQEHGQDDEEGHSPFYGYGRLNAEKAVRPGMLTG